MSIVFELYIECIEKNDAEQIALYFSDMKFNLLTGEIASLTVTQQGGLNGVFGVVIFPNVGGLRGVRSLQDALSYTESGLHMYKHLQQGPRFDFAHVGIEAEQISMADLPNYIQPTGAPNGETWMNFQCVIANNLYEKLGRPKYFREFRPGYMWNQYHGERYSPLHSEDQKDLNDICKQLFPESFDSRLWL